MTDLSALRSATVEQLKYAAMDCDTIAESQEGAFYLSAKLAAAALSLIAEGRESGAFRYGAESLEWFARQATDEGDFAGRIAILGTLAGGDR